MFVFGYSAKRRGIEGRKQDNFAKILSECTSYSSAPVVCVQNFYNIANPQDDLLIGSLAELGIAYVPYFSLVGFSPLQSDTLSRGAVR